MRGANNADIDFFLKLNRAGRELFQPGTSRGDWMDVLSKLTTVANAELAYYIVLSIPLFLEVWMG